MINNPYRGVGGKLWQEGADAQEQMDYDTIIAMHKSTLDAEKALHDINTWYDKVIKGKVSGSNKDKKTP